MSMSGKTTLAVKPIGGLIKRGIPIIAYSDKPDPSLMRAGVKFTTSVDQLEALLTAGRGTQTVVIIDEAPTVYRVISEKTHPMLSSLTSSGRHEGFSARIISQSPTKLPPFVRDNLHSLEVFKMQNEDQAKAVVSDRGISKAWAETIRTLPTLEYLSIRANQEPIKKRVII